MGEVQSATNTTELLHEPVFGSIGLDRIVASASYILHAELDCGAHCTTITKAVFDAEFPLNILKLIPRPILNFDGSAVEGILGVFSTNAHFCNRSCSALIHVVHDSCPPVIGQNLLKPL